MENQVQLFNHPEFGGVRVVGDNGGLWLVGKDVATALGYSNPAKALADHVPAKYKLNNESLSSLGQRGGWLINEAGMYKLVMRSKLPSAEKFSDWVCEEVLPSICKTGMYATPAKVEEIIRNPDAFIETLIKGYLRVKGERDKALSQVAELTPDAEYARNVLQAPNTMAITLIAKEYGMSGKALNKILCDEKIQRPMSGTYVLNSPYDKMGYAELETVPTPNGARRQLKWYEKGRYMIHALLSKKYPTNQERSAAMPELFRGY